MQLTTAIIITAIAVIFSALFSGSEIAFIQSNKVRLQIDGASEGLVNRIIRIFSHNEDMFISTLLVGNNVVLVVYGITFSIIINPLLQTCFDNEAAVLISNTLISTSIILIIGEFLPKTIFRINPNSTMRLIAIPLWLIYVIIYPISRFVTFLSSALMKLCGIHEPDDSDAPLSIDELDDYIQQSIDEGDEKQAVENEVKIFRNAIDFKDTRMGECMIPRNEIIAVNIDGTSRQDLIRKFVSTGLSKIVVFREDIDDVVGYIHVSELFNPDVDWTTRIKPVIFTPETMLANKMMRRMLAEKRSMAVVIDEFGGTAGLATLEDLVEEIFGEIEDEHDHNKLISRQIKDDTYEFSGRVEIENINEEFRLDIPESEDYHTLAGYILDSLGAMPTQGDSFDIDDLRFTIERMTATKLELIKVEKIEQNSEKD